ncbi:MAG TPA: hypothetical protein VK453_25375 [Micromonosporaceae bacterium]|nr:hypothetical protein [Micromonosporaceae bacterium]
MTVWAPTLPQVADYVPVRTIVGAADGSGDALNTFDTTTRPTATQVGRLIEESEAWVTVRVGTVDPSLHTFATQCAALRTAGMIEQSYPDRADDLNSAATLLKLAYDAREDLYRANVAITRDDPAVPGVPDSGDATGQPMPVWSFPPAVTYGDHLL